MTALSADILINNQTGSNTAASGSGPATAVSGTGASTNNTTTVDLSADTPDLSGVSAGDLIWVDSSSGRQFSVIASVDDGADTVTCDDVFTQTESSRNWGIGGKRSTLEGSTELFSDAKGGWEIDVEETGTDYTLTGATASASGNTTDGKIVLKSTSVTRPVINFTPSSSVNIIFNADGRYWHIEHLKFDQTNNQSIVQGFFGGTGASDGRDWSFVDCEITQASSTETDHFWYVDNNNADDGLVIKDCYIHDIAGIHHRKSQGRTGTLIQGNHFKDIGTGTGGSSAIEVDDVYGLRVLNNVIADAGIGLEINGNSSGCVVKGNVFINNSDDGIQFGSGAASGSIITENIFQGNGGFGIDCTATLIDHRVFEDWNAFRNNTSGEVDGFTQGANDITLTADPFVDEANDDYNLNAVAGGGQLLRDATYDLVS